MELIERVKCLKEGPLSTGPVYYWMLRDQRVDDNWGLLFAQNLAEKYSTIVKVIFCLSPAETATLYRYYSFMIEGLKETAKVLGSLNIPFIVTYGMPETVITKYCTDASAIITDFSPLHIHRQQQSGIMKTSACSFYICDSHNIVPCWKASPKREYGAYTIRPKINKLLPFYCTEIPKPKHQNGVSYKQDIKWNKIEAYAKEISADTARQNNSRNIPLIPGTKEGWKRFNSFVEISLDTYYTESNNPVKDVVSHLSVYINFGQISAQKAALNILSLSCNEASKESFIEQLVVRRELSDNFCFYSENYNSVSSFPSWVQETLSIHSKDSREFIYSLSQFESAQTHDPLWNAAQNQLLKSGYMHGYMRMYWAKKILEWTSSAASALETAILLNNRYQLDGNDANGYTGIAWSIGGVHDRAWKEREIFGKIRYMNANGASRKFDVERYISTWNT